VTEAAPEDPTALLNVRAFSAAVTLPVAGVLICAVIVSSVVSIATPPLLTPETTFAVDADNAVKVSPLQVTVTEPAGTATFKSIMMRLSEVSLLPSVLERVDGLGTISQLLADATAETKPVGNVKLIFASTANAEDVLNVNVAVCEAPAAVDMVAVGSDASVLQVAVNGDDAALKPWFVISIDLNAFATPDKGVKVYVDVTPVADAT